MEYRDTDNRVIKPIVSLVPTPTVSYAHTKLALAVLLSAVAFSPLVRLHLYQAIQMTLAITATCRGYMMARA